MPVNQTLWRLGVFLFLDMFIRRVYIGATAHDESTEETKWRNVELWSRLDTTKDDNENKKNKFELTGIDKEESAMKHLYPIALDDGSSTLCPRGAVALYGVGESFWRDDDYPFLLMGYYFPQTQCGQLWKSHVAETVKNSVWYHLQIRPNGDFRLDGRYSRGVIHFASKQTFTLPATPAAPDVT